MVFVRPPTEGIDEGATSGISRLPPGPQKPLDQPSPLPRRDPGHLPPEPSLIERLGEMTPPTHRPQVGSGLVSTPRLGQEMINIGGAVATDHTAMTGAGQHRGPYPPPMLGTGPCRASPAVPLGGEMIGTVSGIDRRRNQIGASGLIAGFRCSGQGQEHLLAI
jgi:hypothetical protein